MKFSHLNINKLTGFEIVRSVNLQCVNKIANNLNSKNLIDFNREHDDKRLSIGHIRSNSVNLADEVKQSTGLIWIKNTKKDEKNKKIKAHDNITEVELEGISSLKNRISQLTATNKDNNRLIEELTLKLANQKEAFIILQEEKIDTEKKLKYIVDAGNNQKKEKIVIKTLLIENEDLLLKNKNLKIELNNIKIKHDSLQITVRNLTKKIDKCNSIIEDNKTLSQEKKKLELQLNEFNSIIGKVISQLIDIRPKIC